MRWVDDKRWIAFGFDALFLCKVVARWVYQKHVSTQSLCSPNEDFGKMNKDEMRIFEALFRWCEYSIWATNLWKANRKPSFRLLCILPKSSFGEHKLCKMTTKDSRIPEKPTRIARHYQRLPMSATNARPLNASGWRKASASNIPTASGQPCGKQHFREIATPDWASPLTKTTYCLVCIKLR